MKNYVSIDLETTGLEPKTDSIIEIGAVKVIDGVEAEHFETFVRPIRRIGEPITRLTGITQSEVEDAPEMAEIIGPVLDWIGELPLLGHSVLFDYSFLKRAAVNQKLSFEKQGIDTLRIARQYLPELESRSLSALCGYYGITHRAHRALADAEATHLLYGRLARQFEKKDQENGGCLFEPFPLLYRAKRETAATSKQKERLRQLVVRHGLQIDYDVDRLTRNQASRYTDQILAEFGQCADGKQSAAPALR